MKHHVPTTHIVNVHVHCIMFLITSADLDMTCTLTFLRPPQDLGMKNKSNNFSVNTYMCTCICRAVFGQN